MVRDPSKYLRKMYKDNINSILTIYDTVPKNTAVPPYCVITSIDFTAKPNRGATEWICTTTLTCYDEYKENGGMVTLDNKCQEILNLLVPENFIYLSIDNFNHTICKVLSIFNDYLESSAGIAFRKTLRFEHLLSQTA